MGTVAALALGYVFGSLPLASLVGRTAGLEGSPRPDEVCRRAGPGPGLLALVADLARGVLPVTLAIVTFSWSAGLAAAAGTVVGTLWPALGRYPGDRSVPLALGALLVLVPALGLVASILTVAVWRLRRPGQLGRDGRPAGLRPR